VNPVTRTAAVSLELARARALLHLGTEPVNAAAERRFARDLDAVRVAADGAVLGVSDEFIASAIAEAAGSSLLPPAPIRPGDNTKPPKRVNATDGQTPDLSRHPQRDRQRGH